MNEELLRKGQVARQIYLPLRELVSEITKEVTLATISEYRSNKLTPYQAFGFIGSLSILNQLTNRVESTIKQSELEMEKMNVD